MFIYFVEFCRHEKVITRGAPAISFTRKVTFFNFIIYNVLLTHPRFNQINCFNE